MKTKRSEIRADRYLCDFPRHACDSYLLMFFIYASMEKDRLAKNLVDKMENSPFGQTYDPTKSNNWFNMRETILWPSYLPFLDDYNPKQLLEKFFGKGHNIT